MKGIMLILPCLKTPPLLTPCSHIILRYYVDTFSCCGQVVGCAGHGMGHEAKASLREPSVFSMSNLRDVVDRLVSGFFYTAPHSPECARRETVVRYSK